MSKVQLIFLSAISCFSLAAQANDPADARRGISASIVMGPTITITAPTETTINGLSGNDYKILYAAKEDAAVFVGTDGETRTVGLQRALEIVRKAHPKTVASDLQIAEAIIAL